MKILQVIAHPAEVSFTKSLAAKFVEGAESVGHSVLTFNVYDQLTQGIDSWQNLIGKADHLNFAWPCMWEMPPAKLVDLLQTVFVRGFAFDAIEGRMVPKLNLPVSCIVSMGQNKTLHTQNLEEAMQYCGLDPMFHIFRNVGPRLTEEESEMYLEFARRAGVNATGKHNDIV